MDKRSTIKTQRLIYSGAPFHEAGPVAMETVIIHCFNKFHLFTSQNLSIVSVIYYLTTQNLSIVSVIYLFTTQNLSIGSVIYLFKDTKPINGVSNIFI